MKPGDATGAARDTAGNAPGEVALRLDDRAGPDEPVTAALTLDYEQRSHSRLRVTLHDGRAAAIVLPRGQVLRGGERLRSACGAVVQVQAADEPVSTALADDARALALACYHLGNRHLALQVGDGWVRYRHDHVIDDMLRRLGLHVRAGSHPFEPEPGAYAHGHAHGH